MACFFSYGALGSLALLNVVLAAPFVEPQNQQGSAYLHAANAGLAVTDNIFKVKKVQQSIADSPVGVGNPRKRLHDSTYATSITVGSEVLDAGIDLMSSDTYFAHDYFKCVDWVNGWESVDQSRCGYSQPIRAGFAGGSIDNQYLNYTDSFGGYLNGDMGYADVTVGNLTIPKQEIGLIYLTNGGGTGGNPFLTSGVLGLGLSQLSHVYTGRDPSIPGDKVSYATVTQNLAKLTKPVFSLALSRNEDRSFFALGGVPPVATGEYTTVPIQKYTASTPRGPVSDYLYYDVKIDSVKVNNQTFSIGKVPQMSLDSRQLYNYVPYEMAKAIAEAYSPPGVESYGQWFVGACDAIPPTVDLVIGGKPIRVHEGSMNIIETENSGNNQCLLPFTAAKFDPAAKDNFYVLGASFLQEIVAVVDVSEKMELKFAMRTD